MPAQMAVAKEAEVNGRTVRSVVEGVGQFSSAYKQRTLDILESHGLPEPEAGEWYPWQAYVDAFEELAETIGPKTVSMIGSKIPELVEWPPTIETVEDAMAAVDEQYKANHRGGDVGYYDFEVTGDGEGVMKCKNPYPSALDEGLLKAIAKKFSDESAFVRVEQVSDGEVAEFNISW